MVHTLPDYSTKYKMATIFGQIDTGELAARLGSPDMFHRSGNIIFIEDFEGACTTWDPELSGAGASADLSNEFPFMGSKCYKLVAGSTVNVSSKIRRYFALPVNTRLGTEWAFTFDDNTDYIRLLNIYYDGTTQWGAVVKLSLTDATITVGHGEEGDVPIAEDLRLYTTNTIYNHLKFVVDFTTHKYVRVIFNNHVYDASDYDLEPFPAPAVEDNMFLEFKIFGNPGANGVSYADNCILTQNEP